MTAFQQLTYEPLTKPKERPERIKTLLLMLTYRRPAGSKTERKFIKKFLYPLGLKSDMAGNLYKQIGNSPILWSSHTDTVHVQGGQQNIRVLGDTVHVTDANSNCLGADCTAGVWIMSEMIKAKIPGLYVFHRAEEKGGLGSGWIAKHNEEFLEGCKYAIAFDRRGRTSIITHQYGGRCCSKAFADSLSTAIGLEHIQDSGGSFTDTANYVDHIGECTNISVGYKDEHSKAETLDIDYLDRLREAMVTADFADLVSERKPGEDDADDWVSYFQPGNGYRAYSSYTGGNYYDVWDGEDQLPKGFRKSGLSMYALCRDHPAEVADFLEEAGIGVEELEHALYMRGAVLRK